MTQMSKTAIISPMKKQRTKTRSHFILFAKDSPFRARKEMNRKREDKKGYRKHKQDYR